MSTRRYDQSQRARPLGLGNRGFRGEGMLAEFKDQFAEPLTDPT